MNSLANRCEGEQGSSASENLNGRRFSTVSAGQTVGQDRSQNLLATSLKGQQIQQNRSFMMQQHHNNQQLFDPSQDQQVIRTRRLLKAEVEALIEKINQIFDENISLRRTDIPDLKKKQRKIYDSMSDQGKRSMLSLSSTLEQYGNQLTELEYINQ